VIGLLCNAIYERKKLKECQLSQQSVNVAKEILNGIISVTEEFCQSEASWQIALDEQRQALRKLETNPGLFFAEEDGMVEYIISDAESMQESIVEDVDSQHAHRTDTSGERTAWDSYDERQLEQSENHFARIDRFLREIRK
jgi:hypothetical protein